MKKHPYWRIIALRNDASFAIIAADWFSSKWSIPKSVYEESIAVCTSNPNGRVPQWYLAVNERNEIIAGMGLIDNDFHDRPDLEPNICAVFVEKPYRGRGIAKTMLDYVRADASRLDYEKVYLCTGHTSFYERCGWHYKCQATDTGNNKPTRIYEADTKIEEA